jgi:hypothetical protein
MDMKAGEDGVSYYAELTRYKETVLLRSEEVQENQLRCLAPETCAYVRSEIRHLSCPRPLSPCMRYGTHTHPRHHQRGEGAGNSPGTQTSRILV